MYIFTTDIVLKCCVFTEILWTHKLNEIYAMSTQ